MYQVSNKDMEDIIKYVEAYRLSVDVKTCHQNLQSGENGRSSFEEAQSETAA